MKKTAIISLAIVLVIGVFSGCSSNGQHSPTTITSEPATTEVNNDISTTAWPAITVARPWHDPEFNWEEVSINFPERYSLYGDQDEDWGFERQYRSVYYALSPDDFDSVSHEAYMEWSRSNQYGERTEPLVFQFIKYFDVIFEESERAAKKEYLWHLSWEVNMLHEGHEIFNPYLLYTFNLERINDYYSLDPKRNESARQWLEEWLRTNEPYESYSTFLTVNP